MIFIREQLVQFTNSYGVIGGVRSFCWGLAWTNQIVRKGRDSSVTSTWGVIIRRVEY